MVRFSSHVTETSDGICVGVVEADPLILLSHSNEVVVRELGRNEVFLWRVAEVRLRTIVIYTSAVLAVLLLLQQYADIALPLGYLTPTGLL